MTKRVFRVVLATLLILLIPVLAMQFIDEVTWDLRDFIIMGTLLISASLANELLLQKMETSAQRVAVAAVIFGIFILFWVELAVGIIGTPFAGS